ncbi:MAG: pafB [Acidimicrobiaceae bacterium]|nr:pafB [Acidimicrobiaceae bacterium]
MPARPNRLERITNLVLALLQTPRPLSLREIGAAVSGYPPEPGALRQAFERDKRTLRDGGIPLLAERIEGDDQVGYRIDPNEYYLAELDLDEEEHAALAFAVAAVRLEGGGGGDALAKLGAPQVSDLPPVVILPVLPALGVVQDAVRSRSPVSFGYHGRRREVEGYGLLFKSGSWYLVGNDRTAGDSGELRTFRIDRMTDQPAVGSPGSYEPPPDFDATTALRFWGARGEGGAAATEAATEVLIDVDVREVHSAIGLVGEAAVIARHEDGSARLRFTVGDETAFIAWALGLGDAVEVVEPAALRALMIERLESIVAGVGASGQ